MLGKRKNQKSQAMQMDRTPFVMKENKMYYMKNADRILNEFNASESSGLSSQEASNRLAQFGPNEFPKVKRSLYQLYLAPVFENTIIVIFLVAATLMVVLNLTIGRSAGSPIINFVVIVLNAFIAIIQQIRAQKSLEALKQLAKNVCTVIRDGSKIVVESSKIVPGDILYLQEGDRIVADARVLNANNFFVNESSITGESVPINKKANTIPTTTAIAGIQDIGNCIFSGTFVTKGNARAMVFSTGPSTEIGRISSNLSQVTSEQEIPLKNKINKFANWLAIFVAIMFFVIWLYVNLVMLSIGTLFTGTNFWRKLVDSIELALKFVPINIVLLATIILITGVIAMAMKGVIVRKLTAVETLGRASIVCTDKTGTLTKNAMTVQKVWADNNIFDITGIGYSKDGAVFFKGNVVNKDDYKSLKKLVIAGLLDNNAEVVAERFKVAKRKEESVQVENVVIGDPMEGALDILGEKLKIYEAEILKDLKLIKEYPFDSELKRMSKIWAPSNPASSNGWIAYIKGATEEIIDRSTTIMEDSGNAVPIDAKQKRRIKDEVQKWGSRGYRTLGIGSKDLVSLPEGKEYPRDDVETSITFLGFVVIQDPPREGVKDSVRACESAGITVVMITGDSKETGASIGKDLTIYEDGEVVVEGKEIAGLNDETFFKTAVFARVSPDDKQTIVKRYQEHGKTVAMTGDGVNDALALGMADVGLAMGITGTDVAKEAADIIISDDSFNTIELGIREGRGLFAKIRSMIYFFIFANVAEAIVLIATSFCNIDFRLFDTGLQINLIYIIPHALPPLGLSFDRTSFDIMKEKPRNAEEIFSKNVFKMLLINIAFLSGMLFIAAGPIILAFLSHPELYGPLNQGIGDPKELQRLLNIAMARPRTVAFAIIFITETATVFCVRRPNIPVWRSFRKDMSPLIPLFAVITMLGLFAVMYVPVVNDLMMLVPLNAEDWGVALILSLPIIPVLEAYKWFVRVKKKQVI
nr:cation-transporting P-type ATPase [Candidatus Sigynarchaeota archaeon]